MRGPHTSGVPHADFAVSRRTASGWSCRFCVHAAVGPRRKRALGDVGTLETDALSACSAAGEAALRRRLSREVWRALAEPAAAEALLADPDAVLGDVGCTLQQHRRLASIRAQNIQDFARQAELLFWASSVSGTPVRHELARAVGQ